VGLGGAPGSCFLISRVFVRGLGCRSPSPCRELVDWEQLVLGPLVHPFLFFPFPLFSARTMFSFPLSCFLLSPLWSRLSYAPPGITTPPPQRSSYECRFLDRCSSPHLPPPLWVSLPLPLPEKVFCWSFSPTFQVIVGPCFPIFFSDSHFPSALFPYFAEFFFQKTSTGFAFFNSGLDPGPKQSPQTLTSQDAFPKTQDSSIILPPHQMASAPPLKVPFLFFLAPTKPFQFLRAFSPVPPSSL